MDNESESNDFDEVVNYNEDEFQKKSKVAVGQDLLETLDNSPFNDVFLIANDGEIKASKLILSARSEYFFKMFDKEHQFRESKGTVRVHCNKNVLRVILEFLYSGKIEHQDLTLVENLELLNQLRCMLQYDAYGRIENQLKNSICKCGYNMEEVVPAVDIARNLKLEKIEDILLRFLVCNMELFLHERFIKEIKNISLETIESFKQFTTRVGGPQDPYRIEKAR